MYKAVGLILLLSVSSCSESEKQSKSDVSEIEKELQESITLTKSKYNELDEYQKLIRDDIQNQLIFIGCSSNRLLRLKNLDSEKFKFIIPQLISKTKFLHATIENGILIKNDLTYSYKYKPDLFIHFKSVMNITFYDYKTYTTENDKVIYENSIDRSRGEYTGELSELIKSLPQKTENTNNESQDRVVYKNRQCSELYKRSIPNSQEAKEAEIKAFEVEIADTIKRIDSFQKRLEFLELLSSGLTVYESGLNRLLREYQVDKNNVTAAQAYIEKSKKFVADADDKLKNLKQGSQAQVTENEIKAVQDVFL
jgi:hypothetical protein